MQNKTPIIVLTGLAVVAAAAIAGLTKDQWMGEKPQVATTAPATTAPATTEPAKPAEQPAATTTEAAKPAEQPAATTTTEAAKPAEQPAATTTTEAAKPAEQPAATTTTEAAKPAEQPAATTSSQQATAQQPAAQQQATAAPQPAQPAAENAAEKPKVPSFDTVRVEKTGEAVIAGTAAAGSDVVVKLDGKEIGQTTANNDGAFVVVPDKPLPPGSGALTIEAKGKGDAQPTASEQSVAVIVPAADQKQEALVAVVSPDKPTRVLQKPEVKQEQAAAPATTTPAQTTTQTETAAQSSTTTTTTTTTPAAPAAEKPAKLVSIDAVDYDTAGNIVFSGGGEAGNTARVYIDNKFIGDAAVGPDGHWSFSGTADVTQGVHTLRVDGLDSAGKVLNRVEVPFFREQQSKVADAGQTAPAATTTTTTTTTTPAATTAQQPAQTDAQATQPAAGTTQQQPAAATTAPATTEQQPGNATAPATSTGAGTATQPSTTTTTTTTPAQPATTAGGTQAAATPAAPKEGRVVIQPGNNLWRISRVLYGNGAKFTTLYEANKDQIRNPNLIYPGQIFRTPEVAPKGGAVDPKRRDPLKPEENEAPAQ